MTDEKMVEAMARLDGIDVVKGRHTDVTIFYRGEGASLREVHPDYLTSHDAVQRVIDGLEWQDANAYLPFLYAVIRADPADANKSFLMVKALPRQKCEAILKTKGVWDELR